MIMSLTSYWGIIDFSSSEKISRTNFYFFSIVSELKNEARACYREILIKEGYFGLITNGIKSQYFALRQKDACSNLQHSVLVVISRVNSMGMWHLHLRRASCFQGHPACSSFKKPIAILKLLIHFWQEPCVFVLHCSLLSCPPPPHPHYEEPSRSWS